MTLSTPISTKKFESSIFQKISRSPAIRTALMAFLLLRLFTAVLGVWAVATNPPHIDWESQPVFNLYNKAFTSQGALRTFLDPWYRWDTGWYIYMAVNGYRPNESTLHYAPAYPAFVHIAAILFGDYLLAAIVVSNLCCIGFFFALYKLVKSWYSHQIARYTIFALALYPAAFYLLAGYTESTFLMFTVMALWAARDKRFILSGLLAILASLTRPQGGILFVPIGYLFLESVAFRPSLEHPGTLLKGLFASVAAPLGAALYLFGIPLLGYGSINVVTEAEWNIRVGFPWESFTEILNKLTTGQMGFLDVVNILLFIFLVFMVIVSIRRLATPFWLYSLLTIVVFSMLVNTVTTRISFESMVRYSMHVFPIFILLAMAFVKRRYGRTLFTMYALAALAGQTICLVLFVRFIWVA